MASKLERTVPLTSQYILPSLIQSELHCSYAVLRKGYKMIRTALVEDDNGVRRTLELYLLRSEAISCVGSYASGWEAMQWIPITQPQVVLMDICMAGISGIDCTRQLKRTLPSVKVVMITGRDDLASLLEAIRAGANGYLTKPFTQAECVKAIQFATVGGAPFSPKIIAKLSGPIGPIAPSPDACKCLNNRECLLLVFLSRGLTDKEIAELIHLSLSAVHSSLKRIYHKLSARNRIEAVQKWSGRSPSPLSPVEYGPSTRMTCPPSDRANP
jgi:DNA-binding NarL/FixJ family response regulator